jgi:4-oxalomesaconate tautomerase
MPVVVLEAKSVGRTGHEPRDQLNNDAELKKKLEEIRLAAGTLMNLGDVAKKVVPKMCLVAPPATATGHIATRSFIPHECHSAIGVFAAVTVATAAVLPGSPANKVARLPDGRSKTLSVEHPTGEFSVRIEVGGTAEKPVVERAGLLRTARVLFDGVTYVKPSVAAKAGLPKRALAAE